MISSPVVDLLLGIQISGIVLLFCIGLVASILSFERLGKALYISLDRGRYQWRCGFGWLSLGLLGCVLPALILAYWLRTMAGN